MKRILQFITMVIASITMNAQYPIENLDEVDMLGRWVVLEREGIFVYSRPTEFIFCDSHTDPVTDALTNPTRVVFQNMENPHDGFFDYFGKYKDYFIGGTSTGRYTLHMIGENRYGGGNNVTRFVIEQYIDGSMVLATYSGDGRLLLGKDDSYIQSAPIDEREPDDRMYNVNGQQISEPHGIYIQDGQKHIAK